MKDQALNPQDAAEWFLVMHSEAATSPEMLQAWLRWIETSEENRRAFEEISAIWHHTPSAVISRKTSPPKELPYDGSISIAEWRAKSQKKNSTRWRQTVYGLAATAVLGSLVVLGYSYYSELTISSGHYLTRTAQHRTLRLSDGSTVLLGGHSGLMVNLNEHEREIRLTSGEAYFDVHKDPTRPFIVSALQGKITAIGTAFNVRTVKDSVTVTVTEGAVKVSDGESPDRQHPVAATPATQLKQGEQITYQPRRAKSALRETEIKHVDASETTRWRDGWLVYRNEPLGYVVADIARYTNLKMEVADSAAATVQFSGAVSKDHINEWLFALPDVEAVTVRQDGEGITIASR